MLEGLVAWVLNTYLGKYVENLNTDQLSIAILQGEVELENLPLRKDALRNIGLPIQVRSGLIGKVKLQIPVRQIRSAPWVVIVERLYVVTGPLRLDEWNKEAEDKAAQEYKLYLLDSMEARWRAETEAPQEGTYSSWFSYGTGLVTNIVENLQLRIKDVHMRYEDDVTVPGETFVCGVTIDSLTAQSCDDKWIPRFTTWEAGGTSFKLMELNTLALYWDSAETLLGNLPLDELAAKMSKTSTWDHHYLVAPVSAQAHIKRNRSEQPLRSRTHPRIVCDLQLDEVPLTLVDWQYAQMVDCIKGLNNVDKLFKQKRWRPTEVPSVSPRKWWLYAARCHGLLLPNSRTAGWQGALSCARDNVQYVKLYSQYLANPGANTGDKQLRNRIEAERSLDELRILREVAMKRVHPPQVSAVTQQQNSHRGLLVQWFPQWWYNTPSTANNITSSAQQNLEQNPIEDQLLDALADTLENNTLLRRDVVFGQCNFTLKRGTFNLCTSTENKEKVPFIELQFENVKLNFETRPRTGSHRFDMELGAIYLRDQMTHDSVFPVLIAPQNRPDSASALPRAGPGGRTSTSGIQRLFLNNRSTSAIAGQPDEPLFSLSYEYKPFVPGIDYRLHIQSQSLDIVYNPAAVKSLIDFFTRPHKKPDAQLRLAARHHYEAMKKKTKEELLRNWEQILEGETIYRKVWDVELNISAPQIIFLEHFCDKNALMVVVDFGKFHFSNRADLPKMNMNANQNKESDEEDDFQTPCSTPPGSQTSEPELSQMPSLVLHPPQRNEVLTNLSEVSFHQKLYDRYRMELGDLQILVGRVRDNWKYAHLKGTSTLHLLDRFNIALMLERRRVFTVDPNFPNLALSATLPRLVVHLNENKVQAIRTIMTTVAGGGLLPSPFRSQSIPNENTKEELLQETAVGGTPDLLSEKSHREVSRLLMLQFTVEHLSIEVQSRGRSIAELQVSGVRASFTKRPYDTSMSLSVHSLLLADALQTFGPDFELLVASHKHVGMDSVSGSLRDSEPTSPTSPGSPDPNASRGLKTTSPIALTQALSSLQLDPLASLRASSPTYGIASSPPYITSPPLVGRPPSITMEPLDAEALITVEILLVSANCPSNDDSGESLQVASIQFNNLDIIANQETIVELLGFAQTIFPQLNGGNARHRSGFPAPSPEPVEESENSNVIPTRTEVTFDFHRLNVLLLRAVVRDGTVVGRKIATATMSQAKIQATIGDELIINGSLGGLQLLDLTPEGHLHPRILSLGKDPLGDRDHMAGLHADLYSIGHHHHQVADALSFSICRPLSCNTSFAQGVKCPEIKIRMASVWYTHSPQLVAELQCCVAEFQQYLTNLARSIKSAATEMAIGLVQARTELLAQNLYSNSKLSASFSALGSDTPSPKRRRQNSMSQSAGDLMDNLTAMQTPYSPSEDGILDQVINVKLDIVLDSPVVVLPRCAASYEVFVAHLGKMSLSNNWPNECEEVWIRREYYNIDVRDINVYSLDTILRGTRDTHTNPDCAPLRAEKLYSCLEEGKPILHDTALHLSVERHCGLMRQQTDNLLLGAETPPEFQEIELHDLMQVSGTVVTQLKISLARPQYEQLLETISTLLTPPSLEPSPATTNRKLADINEEETPGISPFGVKETLHSRVESLGQTSGHKHPVTLKVSFDLPIFTAELKGGFGRGDQGLVDLSIRDFSVQFDKSHRYETNIQMCLRSLLMEDLTKEPGDKHRCLVVSTAVSEAHSLQPPTFVSKSCPNIASTLVMQPPPETRGSLPSHLGTGFRRPTKAPGSGKTLQKTKTVEYPCTPPPSPRARRSPERMFREDNLMHINVVLVDAEAPNFASFYNSVRRSVTVDFNSLDIVANIESWVVVFDFFNIGSGIPSISRTVSIEGSLETKVQEAETFNTDLEVDVRSVTLVLNLPDHEVACANISHLHTTIRYRGLDMYVDGRLGSMSLLDVSPHCHLYRERFVSSGHEALSFTYSSYGQPDVSQQREYDSHLKLEMSTVLYIHTKRFVSEIQAFFHHFSRLRGVMASIRASTAGREVPKLWNHAPRMLLELHAGSPVIMLPVSSLSSDILVVDLGRLTVNNCFKMYGSPGTINIPSKQEISPDATPPETCLLDVMQVELVNMDLYPGHWEMMCLDDQSPPQGSLVLSPGAYVRRAGPSLLQEKCQLHLQVDRNLNYQKHLWIPDMSVNGKLSAVHAALDLSQYKLIRGLLTYNIGENVEDLFLYYSSSPSSSKSCSQEDDRILLSIQLELENVTLQLQREQSIPLAGINFIKSRLLLELMNDGSQDIDLASQEILLIDTRFEAEPVNKRSNVFTSILQPLKTAAAEKEVQAEVHHRRRHDCATFTILLKDMRLMAILNWWEAVWKFIMENADVPEGEDKQLVHNTKTSTEMGTSPDMNTVVGFELKLNITNCEIVLVEDAAQWDSNAVILKSNSVVVYRPQIEEKPLSCELNNCELFSCVLDMEDDTALSIIDPVHISIEIARQAVNNSVLEIISKDLTVRLSYHDMRMFLQILNSLPKQGPWAQSQGSHNQNNTQPANIRNQVNKLMNIGFKADDCLHALEVCHGNIDDAAIWLTQNAVPDTQNSYSNQLENNAALGFQTVTVETTCLRLVIIDDCRDADVPLFEMTLLQLAVKQELGGAGNASCCLCGDYYNRLLSGWEPFLEPWGCQVSWDYVLSSPTSSSENKLNINVTSKNILNVNITSTLVDLFKTVKENWLQDYGSTTQDRLEYYTKSSPAGHRRRSPFVPYAIHNKTGSTLWFHTHVTDMENMSGEQGMAAGSHEAWTEVLSEATVPFTYEDRGKIRHRDTHKHTIHQLIVQVNGWKCTLPVSVDKVGVFFRQAVPEREHLYLSYLDVPEARIVFEVTLEGSAKKLVTVRSALLLANRLHETVEMKLENRSLEPTETIKYLRVPAGTVMPIPLAHVTSQLWIRPVDQRYLYCSRPIIWNHVSKPAEVVTEHRQCLSSRDLCYRFCLAVHRDNYPIEKPLTRSTWLQPGHTITLFSPLCISNLLPYDLHFSVSGEQKQEGHVRPAESFNLHQVDTEGLVEINFSLENFPGVGSLIIPPGSSSFNARVRVQDLQGRRLYLQVSVNSRRSTGYKVSVSVPFWIYNRTGLPLVFRQEGVSTDTAGQFDEHEMARMVAPLMFSFADNETSPTVVARIGNRVHPEGIPHWCNHFHLQKGLQVRRLRVALRNNSPDLVYLIGIEVRPGRGHHRVTHVVTLSPRYQLHNMSSHHLLFAQKCFTGSMSGPSDEATYLKTVPDCNLAWHWPRLDKDQLLCVRLPNISGSLWSGGFQIDLSYSLHVNIRDVSSKMYLLRVEVVLKGATYCVVFTDADTMPPPLRIDNLSEVSMKFYQSCVSDEILQTLVRPRTCVPYAWDEPTQPHVVSLVAPGGASCVYNMSELGPGRGLTYENFIYIAFTGTFENIHGDPLDVRGQQLVLEVQPGSNRVTLARKEQGMRSQLWRMSSEGLLIHEGSSPPHDQSGSGGLVLDIAGPAPQPLQYVPLVLRRPDARRQSTQTWRFTSEGRLCCAHNNMCVQAKDGFFGMRQGGSRISSSWQMWNEVVLGPPQPICHQTTVTGIPIEQAVGRQRLRPGSGFLAVNVLMDGPTTVLQITDLKEKQSYHILHADAHNYRVMAIKHGASTSDGRINYQDSKEVQMMISLPSGVGLSLISQHTPAEELLYLTLKEIDLKMKWSDQSTSLHLLVHDVQCDNQLVEAQCPVPLFVMPARSGHSDSPTHKDSALELLVERQKSSSTNAEIYKQLIVCVKNLSLTIEEKLLLKLFLFVGFSQLDAEQEAMEESDVETQRLITEATSLNTKRYYFGALRLEPSQIRLSVLTSSKLPPELRTVKRKLGLKLIKFEDAAVDMEPYSKTHQFESSLFLVNSAIKHFKEELKWQAAIILGSVDFLGNPLGLVNDVSEGMSGLIFEGNVTALLRNVTHGLSNSAAKVTGSLSDGLGRVILDDQHEERRQRIRKVRNSSSGEHLVAGLKGLGFGLLGGVTSVFKQTYEGAANDGMQGFISGLGKGLVGTVTKPVVGVLDLASEAASAVRDSSRSSIRTCHKKVRETRCVVGMGGLLPPYDPKQSTGLKYLYEINDRNYSELFIAYECLLSGSEDLRILVSSEMVRVFTCGPSSDHYNIVVHSALGELLSCKVLHEAAPKSEVRMYYIELTIETEALGDIVVVTERPVKKPRVRCEDEVTAKQVSHHINYAKGLFEERRNTLISLGYDVLED